MTLPTLVLAAVVTLGAAHADDRDATGFDRQTVWNGYEQLHFRVAGRATYLVAPKRPAAGNPWVWRARFPGYHAEMDIALLARGFHVAHVDVAGMFGNGHHFDHPEVERVVTFITQHTQPLEKSLQELLRGSKRIVFLGDSITYAGHYVAFFDAWLLTQPPDKPPVVIDVGLPSETVSGLSEDGHAGGRFPRPDLDERLERVLSVTKPDLVLACYGINCGIYQPFDNERFRRYQQGIEKLKRRVEAAGATLVLVTPPFYDDQRAKKSFSYNGVLDRYAQWLLAQRESGWQVIDLHGPMTRDVAQRRKTDPDFTFQPDAVHPNAEGHWFVAQQLIRAFGDADAADADSPQAMLAARKIPNEALPLVSERIMLLRDAFLGAAGHQRPGIRPGMPLEEAQQRARKITAQILEQKDEIK